MKGPHYHAKDIAIIPIAGLCHSFLKGLWECWDGCFSFCLNCQYFISFFWLHISCHFPDHISSSRCLKPLSFYWSLSLWSNVSRVISFKSNTCWSWTVECLENQRPQDLTDRPTEPHTTFFRAVLAFSICLMEFIWKVFLPNFSSAINLIVFQCCVTSYFIALFLQ